MTRFRGAPDLPTRLRAYALRALGALLGLAGLLIFLAAALSFDVGRL